MSGPKNKLRDAIFVLALSLAGWTLASLNSDGLLSNYTAENSFTHLGSEYCNVAFAIREGRGFSDPFGRGTGATAWAPPAMVFLWAGILSVSNDSLYALGAIARTLNAIAFIAVAWALLRLGSQLRLGWLARGLVCLFFFSDFYYFFQCTTDVWIKILVYSVIWLGANARWDWSSRGTQIRAGMFGGLAALCCPVAGLVWASILILVTFNLRLNGKSLSSKARLFSLAFLSSALIVAPWTIRNRIALGSWIPIKSNLAFEAFQSQVLDDDGILDYVNLGKHPSVEESLQQRLYCELGETEYLTTCRFQFFASVQSDPIDYLLRVNARFMEACLFPTESYRPAVIVTIASTLSTLSVLFLLATRLKFEKVKIAIAMYLIGLFPHIVVGYSERYVVALVLIRGIIIMLALCPEATLIRNQPKLPAR